LPGQPQSFSVRMRVFLADGNAPAAHNSHDDESVGPRATGQTLYWQVSESAARYPRWKASV
jgi:hypothetical protein